jgi:hypothetical protein
MLITVPRSLMIYPPGYGGDANEQLTFGLDGPGLNGLGMLGQVCTDDEGDIIPCAGGVVDTSNDLTGIIPSTSPLMTGPPLTAAQLAQLNAPDSGATVMPGLTQSQINTMLTPNAPSTTNSTTAQDIAALGPALAGAAKAISVATGPYQIPNTNYIYNPATGQILLNGAAVGTYNPATGALSVASSFTGYLPLLLGVGAIVLLVSMVGGRK